MGPSHTLMSTIQRLEVFSLELPFRREFRTARGVVGSATRGRTVVLVKLTGSDGTIGWGEGSPVAGWSPETVESVVGALVHHFGPAVLGLPVADFAGLHAAMDGAIASLWGASMPIARAALDIAAHDAVGKQQGRSVRDLLVIPGQAPVPDSLTLSWTVTGGTPETVRESLEEAREAGYANANIKVGAKDLGWDLQLCALGREAFPAGFLWGDANGAFPPESAVERARALTALDLLEQPVAPDRISAAAAVVEAVPIPVALDESITGVTPLEELLHYRALSAFALKVTRTGGLWPSRQCGQLARRHGLPLVSSGLTDAAVAFAANAHLAAAMGVERPYALNGPQFLADDIAAVPLPRVGDRVSVPELPGLGIEVDEDKVRYLAKGAWVMAAESPGAAQPSFLRAHYVE